MTTIVKNGFDLGADSVPNQSGYVNGRQPRVRPKLHKDARE